MLGRIPHEMLFEDHLRDALAHFLLLVRSDAHVGSEEQSLFDRDDDLSHDPAAEPKYDARTVVAAETRLIGHTVGQVDLHDARAHRVTVLTSVRQDKGGAIMPAPGWGPTTVNG